MQLWLVSVGVSAPVHASARAALVAAGAEVEAVSLSAEPSRVSLDASLDEAAGRRVVIQASNADLGRVLRRMMRRDELDSTETAVLPLTASPFLARFGITPDVGLAAGIAEAGTVRTVGVLKDDSGFLVVDQAVLRPWSGRSVWVRAYVDDECLCDGDIGSIAVTRGKSGGLSATVTGQRWHRSRTLTGRGLALACEEAAISADGAARDQPRRKRIWWDEPELWRLATAP